MTKPLSLTAKRLGINLAVLAALAPVAHAQVKGETYVGTTTLSSQSEREIVRRQEDVLIARQFITEGDRAWEKDDYETAYQSYLNALDLLGPGAATSSERADTLDSFSRAGIDYANELIENGRYADAERVSKTILLPRYNPTYRPAVALLSKLEQPDYYNKTVTPQFAADRDEVSQLLIEAEGFYTTGRYDLATKRYTAVLNIDRYNIAAQKGLERIAGAKENYYENAYNETRSRLLWEVTEHWELPRKKFQGGKDTIRDTTLGQAATNEQITAKLNRIIIPQLDLRDTTIREAVEYLRQISRQLDTLEPDPAKKGVNIFLKVPSGSASAPTDGLLGVPGDDAPAAAPTATEDTTVTLALNNVPLYEALRYLSDLAGLKIKIDSVAVSIVPVTDVTDELVTKEYRVPPTFIPSQAGNAESAGIASFSFGAETTPEERIQGRQNAQKYLESQSIPFPPGTSANYIATGSRLIVRNTQDNIDLIDVLVDISVGQAPTQVEIEAKFVEVNQNNLKELGFDWALGPLQIGGTNSPIYGAGGSPGLNGADFPFSAPGGGVIGQNNVTGGLRSGQGAGGNSAVSINGLDGLLNGVAAGASPAIFGLSGVFTNPQFQLAIRALNQKKGIDLMSAPKVTTKSGSKAVINIVREFRYPTEFDPPQIPQSTDTVSGSALTAQGFTTSGVITPTTPTAFETRNTGVTLDVTPVVGPDNYTIDLELSPEVVDFEGFINYGTPIRGIDPGDLSNLFTPRVQVVTNNVINQPVFNTRKVTTNVTIWDGMTVALGGLIREDVQKVEDKVPVLGDIPLVGRLFRSDVDQKIKKNLIIFVTAKLMDAEGKPVRSAEQEEEIVELLGVPESVPPPVYEIKGGYK